MNVKEERVGMQRGAHVVQRYFNVFFSMTDFTVLGLEFTVYNITQ